MTYYELESIYEGDKTKHCGLTIKEVDKNFYELETKINSHIAEFTKKFDTINNRLDALENNQVFLSWTMHDAKIYPPGTSNDATYTLINNRTMEIGGEIDRDSEHDGNRFGVAIQPINNATPENYPDAKWFINDTQMDTPLWREIETNPSGWPTALYLYPKVVRGAYDGKIYVSLANIGNCDNTLKIKIQWTDGVSEEYTYIVDENVTLK